MTDRYFCFFSGLGIGLAAGTLFAPHSGARTRQMIAHKVHEGQDFLERQGSEIYKTVSDKIDRTTRAAKRTAEGVVEAVQAGKEVMMG